MTNEELTNKLLDLFTQNNIKADQAGHCMAMIILALADKERENEL